MSETILVVGASGKFAGLAGPELAAAKHRHPGPHYFERNCLNALQGANT